MKIILTFLVGMALIPAGLPSVTAFADSRLAGNLAGSSGDVLLAGIALEQDHDDCCHGLPDGGTDCVACAVGLPMAAAPRSPEYGMEIGLSLPRHLLASGMSYRPIIPPPDSDGSAFDT